MCTYETIDLDYDQFPIPDLSVDLHWIQLPLAAWRVQQKAQREADLAARRQSLPEDHQVLLVPADPDYRPIEQELWPVVNLAVLDCLQAHPEALAAVRATATPALDSYRGWTNPSPAPTHYRCPPRPKTNNRETNPAILLKTNVKPSRVPT